MNRSRAGVLASDRGVEAVAREELTSSNSATAAVMAGFFHAAGEHPGVLLSPLSMLVGGVGHGARAFDGRWRQPGRGARRPRGLLPDEVAPLPARVAIPTSVPALAVAAGYEQTLSFSGLVRPGIDAAKRSGETARLRLLQRIGAVGASAFSETNFVQALLRVAGPSQGGLLTPGDFSAPEDLALAADERRVLPANERRVGEAYRLVAPWISKAAAQDKVLDLGEGHAVIAVDPHGSFAALTYRKLEPGLVLTALGVSAPLGAVPVRRGVTWIKPGRVLFSPCPVALVCDDSGVPIEAIAEPSAAEIGDSPGRRLSLRRDPRTRFVTSAR